MKTTRTQLINLMAAMQNSPDETFNPGFFNSEAQEHYSEQSWSKLHSRLAKMTFEGIDKKTASDIWMESWDEHHDANLPECQYSHDMVYIEKILELIKE